MPLEVLFRFDTPPLEASLAALAQDGIQVSTCAEDDDARFMTLLPRAQAIWHVLRPITAETIAAAPALQLIQKIGVGVNTIDLAAAKKRNIAVCNMPGTNSRAVAEMTLLLMLAAMRRLTLLHDRTREGAGWSMPPLTDAGEIGGRTVGFVGMGAVPQILSPILCAMNADVVYASRTTKEERFGRRVPLDQLLSQSDIVSLHVPLTAQTQGMIGRAQLDRMKRGAVLVNTARGELLDEPELTKALQDGRISAAGLDVFGMEPVRGNNPLLRMENVVVTPHIAWLTGETLGRSIVVARENCLRLIDGRPLLHRVV